MSRPSSLRRLLFKPELQSLAGGRRWNTLVFLSLIYGFSLFSLGSGRQIQSFLEEKMDDPYVKHLLATAPSLSCNEDEVKLTLINNAAFQSRYKIESVEPMAIDYMVFLQNQDAITLKAGGMESETHPLWSMLRSDPELYLTNHEDCEPFTEFTGTGVILSEKAASKLDLTPASGGDIKMVQWIERSQPPFFPVDLPVLAVIKSLPLDLDVVLTSKTFRHLKSGLGNQPPTKPYRFLTTSELQGQDLTNSPSARVPGGRIFSSNTLGAPSILKQATQVDLLDMGGAQGKLDEEYLMFSVQDLSQVRALATDLAANPVSYGCQERNNALEIDLTTVESKENLSIFSSFAFLLSAALVVIALILIVNYTGAILRLHINKNRRNLGTLMAFGYQNGTITKLYLLITATILGLSFAISYLVVWPIGYFGFGAFLGAFGLSDTLADVHFAHIPLYYSIPLFVLLPLVIVSIRIRRQLKATPGDLVYDR